MPVADCATRGIFYLLEKGVTVGVFLIVVAEQLKREEADEIDCNNEYSHPTDNQSPFVEFEIFHATYLPYLPLRLSSTITNTSVSNVLPATQRTHCSQLKNEKASKEKKSKQ